MENKKLKQLQESLAKVAQSLSYKLEQKELIARSSFMIKNHEEVPKRKINIGKILIAGVVTASLGYGIAYYKDEDPETLSKTNPNGYENEHEHANENDNANENEILYTSIGALVGIISSFLVQRKKQSLNPETGLTTIDYKSYKKEVIKDIGKTNEQVRQEWEKAMIQLTENQREQIEEMPWTDEQKELAINNALVYKSIIISDYHYTDPIEDLETNEEFNRNMDLLFERWKDGIVEIINDTKNEQWNIYFSKIYVNETNRNMMS